MWGNIITDLNFNTNFNTQFSNTKSDVLIHLAQWQYWWWFWFSFFWVMYYLLLARVLRYRSIKFRPKISSSFRPHGKWGDVIICILPVSWCFNILVNSNFLLKLLEWQAESSLFTIRIRGKQWYWVYKFDFKNFTDIISTPKNIGNNKWMFSFFGELKTADNYLHIIQMRSQNRWIKNYWQANFNKFNDERKSNIDFIVDSLKFQKNKKIINDKIPLICNIDKSLLCNTTPLNNVLPVLKKKNIFNLVLDNTDYNYNFNSLTNHEESNRLIRNSLGKKLPVTLIKKDITKLNKNNNFFLKLRFSDENSLLNHRASSNASYFTFKQKRYKRRTVIPIFNKSYKNSENINLIYKGNLNLKNNYSLENDINNPTRYYRMLRKNRVRSEKMPVSISKRLLRVKRTLVIPTHINITAITNSYDVVHSWFIPGLGLKMDCVPGRSTHHTFYVDNCGFYYGQCAEICGRYHHHMPIRVCALPFEHFLIWWNSFGLPKLMFPGKEYKNLKSYSFRKFVW